MSGGAAPEDPHAFRGVTYRTAGSGDVGVLLLHPAFADASVFDEQVASLRASYRVVTVDLPGHGDSVAAGPASGRATVGELAPVLGQILDREGLGRVHVVGASLGGLIAQDFALRLPERLRSLTVVGGYAIDDPIPARAQRFELLRWLPMVLFAMGSFRRYVARVSTATEQGRQRFLASAQRFTRASFRSMQGLRTGAEAADVATLDRPLWIVVGEHDLPVACEAAERWHARLPASRLTIVSGAGHVVPLDVPKSFSDQLLAWLAAVDGPVEGRARRRHATA